MDPLPTRPEEAAPSAALPDGHVVAGHTVVKFRCFCGKKVSLCYRHYRRAGSCPRCAAILSFPDPAKDARARLYCPCGRPWDPVARACPGCGSPYHEPRSAARANPEAPPAALPPPPRRRVGWPAAAIAALLVAALSVPFLLRDPSGPRRTAEDGAQRPPKTSPPTPATAQPAAIAPAEFPLRPDNRAPDVGRVAVPAGGPPQSPPRSSSRPEADRPPRRSPEGPAVPPEPRGPAPPRESPFDVMMKSPLPPRPPVDPAPPNPGVRPGPDAAYFADKVLPLLDARCMTCHANARLPIGKFVLAPPGKSGHTSATRKRNFAAALPFVDSDAPEESPLLTKPLAMTDGGVEHGGGDDFRKDSDAYRILFGFVRGDAPTALEATADAGGDQDVRVGRTVRLNAGGSRDPAGGRLAFHWRLAVAPSGSVAELASLTTRETVFRPDRPGTYLVELVAEDVSRTRSDPARVRIRARTEGDDAPPKGGDRRPGAEAARAKKVRETLRRFLGRDPGPGQEERAAAGDAGLLAREILGDALFWEAWVERDLAHLDLAGPFRPTRLDAVGEAARLANGEVRIAELCRAIVADESFARRFPDPRLAAQTLRARWVGERPEAGAPEESAANLAARLPGLAPFFELHLARHHRTLLGSAPSEEDLRRWARSWSSDPAALPAIVREWIAAEAR